MSSASNAADHGWPKDDAVRSLGRLTGVTFARLAIPGCLAKGIDAVSPRIVRQIQRDVASSGTRLQERCIPICAAQLDPGFWRGLAEGSLLGAESARSAVADGLDVAEALDGAISKVERDLLELVRQMRGDCHA